MKPRFWVVCPDFVSGPYDSREAAWRKRDKFDCTYAHEVVESDTPPEVIDSSWPDEA